MSLTGWTIALALVPVTISALYCSTPARKRP